MNYPKKINITIEHLTETSSTNDYLTELCKQDRAKEFYTVIADSQTNGRGQRGNSWESECGKNLTFSTILYPTELKAKQQFCLSMIVAFSIVDALNHYTKGFSIKWPNDIYWKNKKIAGILIENELEGKYITRSIIGIGINVNQEVFHSSAPNPVSFVQITGSHIDRLELFNKVLHNIMSGYIFLETEYEQAISNIQELYHQKLYRKEGFHPYRDNQGEFMARLHEVEPSGHLILEDVQGTLRRYAFKEVEFVL